MSRIYFLTINSFLGLPPVKELLGYYLINGNKDFTILQCDIESFENYFSRKYVKQKEVLSFENAKEFNNQTTSQKIKKYFFFIKQLILLDWSQEPNRNIVHCIDLFVVTLFTFIKKKNTHLIYLQYEMIEYNRLNFLDKFFFRVLKTRSSKINIIVTPEQNRTEYLMKQLPNSSKESFMTIPNSNNNPAKLNTINSVESSKYVVSHIGAVGISHNIKSYLEAIKELNNSNLEFRFIGLLSEEVLELISSYDLSNVVVIGQVKHSELKSHYLNTDVGVILYKDVSLNHRFCAPNKLYEYWSNGIPVIGDILPGLQTVFKSELQGSLIDMNNPINIRKAIEKLVENKSSKNHLIQYFNENLKLNSYLENMIRRIQTKGWEI